VGLHRCHLNKYDGGGAIWAADKGELDRIQADLDALLACQGHRNEIAKGVAGHERPDLVGFQPNQAAPLFANLLSL
jgi:hypothetical protein